MDRWAKCILCKYSYPLDLNARWTAEMQKCLDEELENNNIVLTDPRGEGLYRPIRHFWQTYKSQYDDKIDRQNKNIECRRFPQFVERGKHEGCGEFSK